jgi:hypothetical protein
VRWSQFWFGSHPTTLQRIAISVQLGRRMGVTLGPGALRRQ